MSEFETFAIGIGGGVTAMGGAIISAVLMKHLVVKPLQRLKARALRFLRQLVRNTLDDLNDEN